MNLMNHWSFWVCAMMWCQNVAQCILLCICDHPVKTSGVRSWSIHRYCTCTFLVRCLAVQEEKTNSKCFFTWPCLHNRQSKSETATCLSNLPIKNKWLSSGCNKMIQQANTQCIYIYITFLFFLHFSLPLVSCQVACWIIYQKPKDGPIKLWNTYLASAPETDLQQLVAEARFSQIPGWGKRSWRNWVLHSLSPRDSCRYRLILYRLCPRQFASQ